MDYVDANILIYAFAEPQTPQERTKAFAARKLLLDSSLLTSTLSLDEVAYKFLKASNPPATAAILHALVQTPKLEFKEFREQDFPAFIGLLESGVMPRDAIHATTALAHGCKTIYSEDPDFNSIIGLKRKTPW